LGFLVNNSHPYPHPFLHLHILKGLGAKAAELRILKDLAASLRQAEIGCKGVSRGQEDKFAELRILKELRMPLANVWQGKELFGIGVGTAEELNAEMRSAERFRGEGAGRGCVAANTGKNSTEVHFMSIHLLGIIRMKREGVEKTGG
jgi:hypothetical protein